MSDDKTPANPPSGRDAFEQEFEKFLRGDETTAAATYRKLSPAEPDAGLDARVRAHARGALRDAGPAAVSGANPSALPGGAARAQHRRWIRAFASAAVLVLAAGIVWRLAPQGWSERDRGAASGQADAIAAKRSDAPAATSTVRRSAETPSADANGAPTAGVAPPAPAQPAATIATRAEEASTDRAGPSRSPPRRDEAAGRIADERELAKADAAPRNEAPRAALPNASERGTVAEKPASPAVAASVPFPASSPSQVASPVSATTPPSAEAPAAAAVAEDSLSARKRKSEATSAPLDAASAQARRAARPSPPSPARQAALAIAQPPATPRAEAPASVAAAPAQEAVEHEAQAFAGHSAPAPAVPRTQPAGRPTPAELAAWPAPDCQSSRAGTPDLRNARYPPAVPATPELRFAIVQNYLDLESPEGAAKAYADFKYCFPDDRWPASLLRRLGNR